ncbi:alsin, partial [Biomphalaria glabrata]
MASTDVIKKEKSDGSQLVSEQKPTSAYLWRGFCDNLNITAYELFTKVNITDIALGTNHSLFLTDDGSVYVNGENNLSQLGLGLADNKVVEEPLRINHLSEPCVHIACGSFHNAVVTQSGKVYCWGSSSDGQCGTGSLDRVHIPTLVPIEINKGFCQHGVPKPATSVDVETVACGASHTLALSCDGEVWAWGAGPQLGLGELRHAPVPRRVETLQGQLTLAVCCGDKHSMALVQRQEKSASRTASPRTSPLKTKGQVEARDVQEDKLYPSRCSTCNKEIYTYTDTSDMCIIDTLHSCTVSDTAIIDSTLVEEVSMSSSSNEVSKRSSSPSPEKEEIKEQNELSGFKDSNGPQENSKPNAQREMPETSYNQDGGPGGLVEETSFLESAAFDSSVLVVSGDDPFEDATHAATKMAPVSEDNETQSTEGPQDINHLKEILDSSSKSQDTGKESSIQSASDGSDDEIWKRRSETDDGDEEVKSLLNKQRVRSPSTTSLRSINLLKQSEALEYLQRQFEDEEMNLTASRTVPEAVAPSQLTKPASEVAAAKEDKSQTSFGNMFDMFGQVKSMTSRAFTNIQTLSGFGSTVTEEPSGDKTGQDNKCSIELTTVQNKSANSNVVKSQSNDNIATDKLKQPEDQANQPDQMKKSGTFLEWSREMANVDDDPSSLTRDLTRKSIRTIELQQKNLNRTPSTAELLPQNKIVTATNVWVWGSNDQGQLGLGDQLERSTPVLIKFLAGRQVIKLAAGESHSLAVTSNSQVYSWGSNSYGQIGQPDSVYGPTRVKLVKGCTVWDVGAGQSHSVFLGDSADGSDSPRPVVLYCGKHPSKEKLTTMKKTNSPVALGDIKQLGWITKVTAGGSSCACKVMSPALPYMEPVFDLAASERAFYNQLIKTSNLLLRPLQKSAFYTAMDVYPYKSSLQNMVSSFGSLTKKIGEGITDLTLCIQTCKPFDQSLMSAGHGQFVEAFRQYSCKFSDFLAVGGFDYCTRAGSEFFEKTQEAIKDLSEEQDKNVGASTLFMRAMRYPFFRLAEYSRFLNKISSLIEKKETKDQIQNVILDWDALKVNFSAEHKLAEATRVFWETSKISDTFKTPNRRVLRESKTHPLTWPAGGRFMNRLFVLFNDGLLHVQGTTNALLPLETLWVESGTSEAESPNTVIVIAPEERFELQVTTPAQKAEWLIAFNSAISKALTLHKPMSKRNSSGERFTPPLIRSASHKFTKPGIYKDASYEGSWISGKVHGSGVMKWSDGSIFEGEFKKGLLHGPGVFTLVKSSGKEIQKGHWKDGKLNGKGIISYANGDYYEGYFQDGQRFGHGMLQRGRHKSNCSSVYIGEWLNNQKDGYGVHDDILKGEKYMGMWVENFRHGSGVLVTLDGMYFEGTFVQNKLTGFGVMISDDNTLYEGDFVGTTYLSGKGVLTLSTGDKLEGNFSGTLNEGLKFTGTFNKSSSSSDIEKRNQQGGSIKSKYFGRLCVSADNKWEDIFSHCWAILGQSLVNSAKSRTDTEKAWELVAVMVTSGRNSLKSLSGISPTKLKVQQNTLEELAKIPAHGADKCTVEVVQEISAYLTKAFDTIYHPLGQLMETLVDVFRASYIGIGAHPRLLHHAKQEVMSYVHRLYRVVRILFPALPANGGPVHVYPQSHYKDIARTSEEAQEFIEGLEVEDPNIYVLTAPGLLYPILLPKIYPPLFDLYALYNEASDDRYWERVSKLNRQSDMGLMAYLGIEQRFWLMEDILEHDKTQKLSTIKDVCYAEAVDVLQQLSTAFSPLEKLKIIEQSFNEITK